MVSIINENKEVIARYFLQIACSDIEKFKINLTCDKPIYYQPYRLSHSERFVGQGITSKLLDADIIEKSISP